MNTLLYKVKKIALKAIIILPSLGGVGGGLASCSDYLTLYPEDDIVDDTYWDNGDKVQSVVAASYRYFADNNVLRKLLYWGEVRSDNVSYVSGGNDVKYLVEENIQSTNSIVKWDGFYKVINICNTVIDKAPAVCNQDPNFTEEKMHNYVAEEYTMRALCYFYLIRAFGDVPYITTPSDSEQKDYLVSQTSQDSIVTCLISDLETYALPWAPEDWDTEEYTHGRITTNAVRALLADLYLWKASDADNADAQKDYQKCVDYCNAVLNDENSTLVFSEQATMYNDVFYEGNAPENIFEINFVANGLANTATSAVYGNTSKSQTGQVTNTQNLLNCYGDNDTRRFQYLKLNCSTSAGIVSVNSSSIFKYEGQRVPENFGESSYTFRSSDSYANWIIYRLADIYLMKAEALAEIAVATSSEEKAAEALACCNVIYSRANQDKELMEASLSDIQKKVLEERRREFCFEGKRWFDLMRKVRRENSTTAALELITPSRSGDTKDFEARLSTIDAWYLPIAETEISANPRLHQNSYYAQKD